MTGFSEASMHVEEARRYSRRIGFSRCDSVIGTPGNRRASSVFDLQFVDGIDDRPDQADGDGLRFRGDEAVEHCVERGLVERFDDASVTPNPFGRLEG
jgi:hypothetical protein